MVWNLPSLAIISFYLLGISDGVRIGSGATMNAHNVGHLGLEFTDERESLSLITCST